MEALIHQRSLLHSVFAQHKLVLVHTRYWEGGNRLARALYRQQANGWNQWGCFGRFYQKLAARTIDLGDVFLFHCFLLMTKPIVIVL
jgi:hypothetical protein